jgi:hypothetical protein
MSPFSTAVVRSRLVNIAADCSEMKNDDKISGSRCDRGSEFLYPFCYSQCYGSGAFLTPGSGMGKKSGSGSGMNNLAHIYESLEAILWVKTLELFDAVLGSGME